MKSKVISYRVSRDLYEEFDQKCQSKGVSPTFKLREPVDSVRHQTDVDTDDKVPVKVTHVESHTVEKVVRTETKKKSWFPLDLRPLCGKEGD